MAITRPKPREFNPEDLEKVASQTAVQEVKNTVQRSTDPENFPVFEIPAGERLLVYVPNHTMLGDDEEVQFRMDAPFHHTLHPNEKTWIKVRCTRNITLDSFGLDGTCPICDTVSTGFDLANLEIERAVRSLPGSPSPDDKSNEQVKSIRSATFNGLPVKTPDRSFTFPIVVIDTELNKKGSPVPRANENGEIGYRIMWYTISERKYEKTWANVFEDVEEDVDTTTIGGHMYIMSYGKPNDDGTKPNKRDAANAFMPKLRKTPEKLAEITQKWDKETQDWTPGRAIQTVIDNQFQDMEWLSATAGEMEQDMKIRIDLLKNEAESNVSAEGAQTVSLDSLKGGGASATGLAEESGQALEGSDS